MQSITTGESADHGRGTIDVINYYTIVVVIVAAVAIASVVGVAVIIGEFDEPEPEEDLTNATDVGIDIETLNGEVRVTWTDEGEAEYLSIRDADGEFERIEIYGDTVTVGDRPFSVVAVYEDGEEATVEEYVPTP